MHPIGKLIRTRKISGTFLDYFDRKFYPRLKQRKDTFRKIFEFLESKNKEFYTIVETGCARIKKNWKGDGLSTILFDQFVSFYEGQVFSVDINPSHCALATQWVSKKTKVVCQDSVQFLWNLELDREIDLVYLDSFDLEASNPHPSALHHLKEFCAIIDKLKKGTLIVVDDHINEEIGKGKYIEDFMKSIGHERVINGYQIGWIL